MSQHLDLRGTTQQVETKKKKKKDQYRVVDIELTIVHLSSVAPLWWKTALQEDASILSYCKRKGTSLLIVSQVVVTLTQSPTLITKNWIVFVSV